MGTLSYNDKLHNAHYADAVAGLSITA